MAQSWLTAALGRAKRMPGYIEFMNKKRKSKPKKQTPDEMLERVKMLHAALGGD